MSESIDPERILTNDPNRNERPKGYRAQAVKSRTAPKAAQSKIKDQKFTPGAFAPVISLSSFKKEGCENIFETSSDIFDLLNSEMREELTVCNDRFMDGRVDVDLSMHALQRVSRFAVAKKLTYSCREIEGAIHHNDFKVVRNVEIEVPKHISLLAEGLGKFNHEGVDYAINELPLEQFNAFAQAVCNDVGYDLTVKSDLEADVFHYNEGMRDWKPLVQQKALRELNTELSLASLETTIGHLTLEVPIPKVDMTNVASYSSELFASSQVKGLTQKAKDLATFLVATTKATGPSATEAKAAGYRRHCLNKQQLADKMDDFLQWYRPFLTFFRIAMKTETIRTMGDSGRPWQILNTVSPQAIDMHSVVSLADQQIGFMLGVKCSVPTQQAQIRVISNDKSAATARRQFVTNMATARGSE